jgi:hypothetical protein
MLRFKRGMTNVLIRAACPGTGFLEDVLGFNSTDRMH